MVTRLGIENWPAFFGGNISTAIFKQHWNWQLAIAIGLVSFNAPISLLMAELTGGFFSLAAVSRWPTALVIAFEPVPSNLEAIKSHLEANHVENLVRVEPVPLSGSDGNKRFFIREANQGSFSGDLPAEQAIDVKCRALAQYLPPDPELLKLIKLDIEGAEVEVLDPLFKNGGTKKTIVVLELHNTPITRPWIEHLAHRIGFTLEFFEIGSVTAHCQLTSPDL